MEERVTTPQTMEKLEADLQVRKFTKNGNHFMIYEPYAERNGTNNRWRHRLAAEKKNCSYIAAVPVGTDGKAFFYLSCVITNVEGACL